MSHLRFALFDHIDDLRRGTCVKKDEAIIVSYYPVSTFDTMARQSALAGVSSNFL